MTLLTAGMNASGSRKLSRTEVQAAWDSLTASTKNWHEMRPAGQNFSILVPDEGRQLTAPVAFGDEHEDLNMYIAREGGNLYTVLWLTGPTYGESDKLAMESMVLNGFVKASHKSYEVGDRGHFFCGQKREKDISTNGYAGIEFDLSSCSLPTRARAFTKVVDGRRQMYMGIVFYGDEDENVSRFLKSFTVAPKVKNHRR